MNPTYCSFVVNDAMGRLLFCRREGAACFPGAWKGSSVHEAARRALSFAQAVRKLPSPTPGDSVDGTVEGMPARIEIYTIVGADLALGHGMFWEYPDLVRSPRGVCVEAFLRKAA